MKQTVKYFLVVLLVLLIGLSIVIIGNQPGERLAEEPDSFEDTERDQRPRITAKDNELDLLARAVFSESRGEPYEGMVAVAAVILNRIDHPEFPNTIAGVVYEPLAFQVVRNGQINQQADELAIQAAFEAINGIDPSNGALYFYNPNKTRNQWIRRRPVLTTIGKHIFAS